MRQIIDTTSPGTTAHRPRILPVDNATTPYWRSDLHPIDEHRSTDQLPHTCDVAIIGAGMSGVATAYHLAQSANPPSIVLLEARQVCSGATGRNGGHIKLPTPWMLSLMDRHGVEAAQEVADLVYEQIYAVKRAVETEGLECEFEMRRSFDVFLDAGEAEEMRGEFEKCLRAGQRWTSEVAWVGGEVAEEVTSVKGAKGAFSVPACSLWPYKFVSQLLARLLDRGAVNLQTNTPVTQTSASTSPSKPGTTILTTPRGTLNARHTVLATNAYTAGIAPSFQRLITPARATASHIRATTTPLPAPHLGATYNISYTPERTDYLNPRPDGGVVAGGAKWTFASDRDAWYDSVDDATVLPQARGHFEGLMGRCVRGWEGSGDGVDFLWTGIVALTGDGMPFVGEVPGAEGALYVIAGFNGGGMPLIFLCAKGLARMVVEGVGSGEVGMPKVFLPDLERFDGAA